MADDDDDNDGFIDSEDAFPLDPSDWLDTDGDTVGDLSDTDDDNDGVDDVDEHIAGTDSTSVDTDDDGICDGPYARQSCTTGPDPYPIDPLLPMDTDGDGLWDNLPHDAADNFVEDFDDDGDGLDDTVETGTGFYISPSDRGTDPLNPDSDGDGFCDGSNEVAGTCSRGEDPYPFDANIPFDRDKDRLADDVDPQWPAFYGDEDADDDGDGYTDSMEYKCDSSALNPNDVPDDLDGDFICDDEAISTMMGLEITLIWTRMGTALPMNTNILNAYFPLIATWMELLMPQTHSQQIRLNTRILTMME